MLHLRNLFYNIGFFVIFMSAMMAIPALSDLFVFHNNVWQDFAEPASVGAFLGVLVILMAGERSEVVSHRDALLLTTCSWVSLAILGMFPFMFSPLGLDITDAFFETMSGLTTTGSTVIVGLDTLPQAFLLWRALLEWIGGIGIIAFALVIFPFVRVGGMHLLRTEFSDTSDKVLPRIRNVVYSIGSIYLGLTVTCALMYKLAGMSFFDAIIHAMTTMSTGGFSTHDQSMGYFANNEVILWISSFFMLLASLPFVLYLVALREKSFGLIFKDEQVRFMLFVYLVAVAVMVLYAHTEIHTVAHDAEYTLVHTVFNVISTVTTTGYASDDYSYWGALPVMLIFFLTFFGGCAGSTSGGFKAMRFIVILKLMRRSFFRILHPKGMLHIKYNGKILSDESISVVGGFTTFWVLSIFLTAIVISAFDFDMITSMTAAMTAVANVGPGLGELIGPSGNFIQMSDIGKWLLSFDMLLGRLEILTVLVIFTPHFWRV